MKFRIMPDKLFVIFIILIVVLHFISSGRKIISPPYHYLGIVLILFGLIVTLWTDHLFKKNKTEIKPYEDPVTFVTSGPFRISRNPMYLGMSMILLGLTVFLGSWLMLVFPVSYIVIMDVFFIRFEEKNLERVLSAPYLDYKKRVRRWI
jgi:protein-S-isoprenylcysteine O-methyltransferase Ste14